MEEKFKKLQEPLSKDDIEFRIGNVYKGGYTILLYKTARVDTKRLNDVFGLQWKRNHYIDTKGNVVCVISIYNNDIKEWVSREDVGSESNTEKEKGAYSDAFKRSSTTFGVGSELYNAPFIWIPTGTKEKADGRGHELQNKFDIERDIKRGKIVEMEGDSEKITKIAIQIGQQTHTFYNGSNTGDNLENKSAVTSVVKAHLKKDQHGKEQVDKIFNDTGYTYRPF